MIFAIIAQPYHRYTLYIVGHMNAFADAGFLCVNGKYLWESYLHTVVSTLTDYFHNWNMDLNFNTVCM